MSPSLRRDGPSRPPGRPRLCPVAVHHEMDDADGLPLSSPLPLSPPAVQALIDNQDALPSSESTGGDDDVDMEESDMVIMQNSAPASPSSSLETNENKDDGADGEPPSVGGAPPPSPTSAPTVRSHNKSRPQRRISEAKEVAPPPTEPRQPPCVQPPHRPPLRRPPAPWAVRRARHDAPRRSGRLHAPEAPRTGPVAQRT